MADDRRRRILPILGWVVAAVVLLVLLASKYEISFRKKSDVDKPLTSTPAASESSTPPVKARGAAPTQPAPAQSRVLTTEELFSSASPAVLLVEIFDDEGHARGRGSGFVVSSEGTAITNYHVIRGAYRANAKFSDGTFAPVLGVAAYDPGHDVAVIKIQAASPPTLKLGNSDNVHIGDHIVAIGSPLGLQNTVSEGIVSALRENIIQMSAPISPGSSGGPVLNMNGEVVGISTLTVTAGQNLNFAAPINWAKRYVGESSVRSLSEIAKENTVTQPILTGSMSIPAGESRSWQFQFNPNVMSGAEVHGEIHSTGGLNGNVTLSLYYGNQLIANCPRQTSCAIHEDLSRPGTYALVLDNKESSMFPRQVTGQIALRYVK
jgi:S1-C subfamily serine protease